MDMDDNGYVIAIWKLRFSIGVSAPLFGQGIRCSNWGWFVRLGKLGGWFILVYIIYNIYIYNIYNIIYI